MKQAYNTSKQTTDKEEVIRQILNECAKYVTTIDLDKTPADLSNFVYKTARELSGDEDPYKEAKKYFNTICLEKLPELKNVVEESEEPMKTAINFAIMGNVIDMGIDYKFDLDEEIQKLSEKKFMVDDYEAFKESLAGGKKKILYLGDNAGEIVFDLLLVDILRKDHEVTYVVKRGPIINDSTMDDAKFVGMTNRVKVIDTGSNGIGVKWDEVSDEFMKYYNDADFVISKGQGNFETNNDREKTTFFLLRAKCDTVAEMNGVSFGDIIFKKGPVL